MDNHELVLGRLESQETDLNSEIKKVKAQLVELHADLKDAQGDLQAEKKKGKAADQRKLEQLKHTAEKFLPTQIKGHASVLGDLRMKLAKALDEQAKVQKLMQQQKGKLEQLAAAKKDEVDELTKAVDDVAKKIDKLTSGPETPEAKAEVAKLDKRYSQYLKDLRDVKQEYQRLQAAIKGK